MKDPPADHQLASNCCARLSGHATNNSVKLVLFGDLPQLERLVQFIRSEWSSRTGLPNPLVLSKVSAEALSPAGDHMQFVHVTSLEDLRNRTVGLEDMCPLFQTFHVDPFVHKFLIHQDRASLHLADGDGILVCGYSDGILQRNEWIDAAGITQEVEAVEPPPPPDPSRWYKNVFHVPGCTAFSDRVPTFRLVRKENKEEAYSESGLFATLPGGKRHLGETLIATAMREAFEELGVHIVIDDLPEEASAGSLPRSPRVSGARQVVRATFEQRLQNFLFCRVTHVPPPLESAQEASIPTTDDTHLQQETETAIEESCELLEGQFKNPYALLTSFSRASRGWPELSRPGDWKSTCGNGPLAPCFLT